MIERNLDIVMLGSAGNDMMLTIEVPAVRIPSSEKCADGGGAHSAEDHAAEVSRLFREHNRTLILFLAARLKDVQSAREIAQEAYVKVLQLQSPGSVKFLRAYLFKVAGNLAIDWLRQQRARARIDQTGDLDDALVAESAEWTVIARSELANIGKLIAELPKNYQSAFRMHRLEDRSFADIATLMGIKERMVRRYVTNTLAYLRLRREGVSSEVAWQQIHSCTSRGRH
jgi:RNA polymerase sigma-70 factor (ECF subfamily)